ncbi:phage protein NinX family protein [Xenorhabdus sp. Sc-CR9]|uniref:phage protein NinX family protein n=1 Tax=Xenorhabdus sp. Sc-CR9 TaxID=2584468 RepID=UPI001F32AEF7|nr:phage protein NinX family protein [Xenorhabdus sp. Sc-CR9]
MKLKTNELTGIALDWAVAKAIGLDVSLMDYSDSSGQYLCSVGSDPESEGTEYSPSTDWEQCGSLIEKYQIVLTCNVMAKGPVWSAGYWHDGETPQIAVCRNVVDTQLGGVVDVPNEFIQS